MGGLQAGGRRANVCSKVALRLLCATWQLGLSLGCNNCFIDLDESRSLCIGYVHGGSPVSGIPLHDNVEECFKKLDVFFTDNPAVISAARVGKGHDVKLKEIMKKEVLPIVDEFKGRIIFASTFDTRLKAAADNFIAAASQLPRASGCIPPCGFQSAGATYNCITCNYDTCGFPLDCPVQEITATEGGSSQMRCDVSFQLPDAIMAVWRFADEIKTLNLDHFDEVTAGTDMLFSIPTVSLDHQGTYQCEIYSKQLSIVRLYYYLSVVPRVVVGHTELQEMFELSLLPGGRLLPSSLTEAFVLSPLLVSACLTVVFLLLFLALGALIVLLMPKRSKAKREVAEGEESTLNLEEPSSRSRGRSLSQLFGLRGSTLRQADSTSQC